MLEIVLSVTGFEILCIFNLCQKGAIGVAVEDQGYKAIGFEALPIHTYITRFYMST